MKPIRSIKNQYRGINAHLHSQLQKEDGPWNTFHHVHIVDILVRMKWQMRFSGYNVDNGQSLQIRFPDEPDDYTKHYRAVELYEYDYDLMQQGELIASIELMSPLNKPGGAFYHEYKARRSRLLETGLVFIELDYVDTMPPVFEGLPSYISAGVVLHPNTVTHPYRITVVDPRPAKLEGLAHVYQFDVDDPLPTVAIPLNNDDQFVFDFGSPYQKTFEEMVFGLELVDYSQLPANFDRYSPADQARIVSRMLAVLNAVEQGVDLETGPFPVEPAPLDAGLARLEGWRGRTE